MKHAELLPAQLQAYFYHVPGESDYSIVQTFDLWHNPLSLPFAWTWLEQDDASSCVALVEHAPSVSSCSKTCRLSNHSTAVMPCPLLPVESNPIYLGNDTHGYNRDINPAVDFSGPSAVEYVYLDANLRHTFTNGDWTFFPKYPGTFVAHFLKPVADQAALYHNVTTRPLGCELRALYQNFARAVLALRHGHQSRSAPKDGNTSETAWADHDVELERGVDSVDLPQGGCDITYQGVTTKRQRTLSFATDSSLESTVPSVSLDNSHEFDDGWVHHSAPTGLSPQNGEPIVELQMESLATDRARSTIRS